MGESTDEVQHIIEDLFEKEMLGGLESILEWAIPGIKSDVSECFKDEEDARRYALVPFLRWWGKVDKPQ